MVNCPEFRGDTLYTTSTSDNPFLDFTQRLYLFINRYSKSYKSYKRRRKKEALEKFNAINQEYDLRISQEDIEAQAQAYAYYKTEAKGVWFSSWVDVFTLILTAVMIVVTFGTYAIPAAAMLTTMQLAGYALMLVAKTTASELDFIGLLAGLTQMGNTLLKNALDINQSSLDVALALYPYSICADGEIYKQGRAGSESFSPSVAYDPSKGLYDTMQESKDQTDEYITHRAHKDLAGNSNFLSTITQSAIPIVSFQENKALDFTIKQRKYKDTIERLNKGFSKLTDNEFGMKDEGADMERIFEASKEECTKQQKAKMINDDFLDRLKNYSRGLRADFNYMLAKMFEPSEMSEEEREAMRKEIYTKMLEKYNALSNDPDVQAENYLLRADSFVDFCYDMFGQDLSANVQFVEYHLQYRNDTQSPVWIGEKLNNILNERNWDIKDVYPHNKTPNNHWYRKDRIDLICGQQTQRLAIPNDYYTRLPSERIRFFESNFRLKQTHPLAQAQFFDASLRSYDTAYREQTYLVLAESYKVYGAKENANQIGAKTYEEFLQTGGFDTKNDSTWGYKGDWGTEVGIEIKLWGFDDSTMQDIARQFLAPRPEIIKDYDFSKLDTKDYQDDLGDE